MTKTRTATAAGVVGFGLIQVLAFGATSQTGSLVDTEVIAAAFSFVLGLTVMVSSVVLSILTGVDVSWVVWASSIVTKIGLVAFVACAMASAVCR